MPRLPRATVAVTPVGRASAGGGGAGVTPFSVATTAPSGGASYNVGAVISIAGTLSKAGTVTLAIGSHTGLAAVVVGLAWSYAYTVVVGDVGTLNINAHAVASVGIETADALQVSVTAAVATVLGQVATRTYIPETNTAGAGTKWNVRTGHFLRCTGGVTGVQVAWPNWFCSGNGETGSGGTMTINAASIEYPAGTFTQVRFNSGSATAAYASGTTQLSDVCAVSIPNGAKFWVKWQWENSVGIIFGTVGQLHSNAQMGDCVEQSSVNRTLTAGGDLDTSPTVNMYPCAIVGQTSDRTLAFIGDSRTAGVGDTINDASGDLGQLARPLGPTYAYLNLGSSGEQALGFINGHTQRALLANTYATTIVNAYGINDFVAINSASALETSLATIRGYFAGKDFRHTTLTSKTTGAWTLADGSDQTVSGFAAQLQVYNTDVRAGSLGGNGFLDIASFQEHTAGNSKWKADGTSAKYTADGLHASTFGYKAITLTLP